MARIGTAASDQDAAAGLRGDAAALVAQVKRYAGAGVDQLVIEPAATELDDFIEQITQFASEVAPRAADGQATTG
jgi:hypothetical protein